MNDDISDIYALAPLQRGMLFHTLLEPGTGLYVEQLRCHLVGVVDEQILRRAWQGVVSRHAVLRTAFVWEGVDDPVQVVMTDAELAWHVEDWRSLSSPAQSERLKAFLEADRTRGFELETPPLMRCALFRRGEADYEFVWTHHHLLLDGWCLLPVLRDVFEIAEAFRVGRAPDLPPTRPYRDYVAWVQAQPHQSAMAYWREQLEGFETKNPLPFAEREREPVRAGSSAMRERSMVPAEATARLHALAKTHRLTINTMVQAAWAILLARCGDRDDVVFGVTVSSRPPELTGVETMVGLFINTLPLRVQVPTAGPLLGWLQQVQKTQRELDERSFCELTQVQGCATGDARRGLFDSLIVFENYPRDAMSRVDSGFEIRDVEVHERTNYPVTVVIVPQEELELCLLYEPSVYRTKDARRLLEALRRVLLAFLEVETIEQVELLDPSERAQLVAWNATDRRPPGDACSVCDLIERRAHQSPEADAVVAGDITLSYEALDRSANALAARLMDAGLTSGERVAVHLERGPELVVALLAVLKCGAAYVPLDVRSPRLRTRFMLEDSAASMVVTSRALRDRLGPLDPPVPIVLASGPSPSTLAAEPPRRSTPEDPVYAIYTSGSSGRPKAVLVSNGALLNLVRWHVRTFELEGVDRCTQVASPAFDAAGWEIWPTLAAGASLHIAPDAALMGPEPMRDWLVSVRATVGFVPTPLAEAMLRLPWPAETALRTMLIGGDRLHAHPPEGLPFALVNNYGPTEATVVTTSCPVAPEGAQARVPMAAPPIGRPIDNTRVYVLDRNLRPTPIGVPGELCVAGAGVAIGYLGREELTAERFIADPFGSKAGARLYRTGDLVRRRDDGEIEFLGRLDEQVKIRGYRVELQEIECALLEQPGVAQALVIVTPQRADAERLVAFVVPHEEAHVDASTLAASLQAVLPEYMVPSRYVVRDSIPHTLSGKPDRQALITVDADLIQRAYVAPRTTTEEIVAHLFAEVLDVAQVGVEDDFFRLGGHSLNATRLISRAQDAFDLQIPLETLFREPSVAGFASAITSIRDDGKSWEPITPRARGPETPQPSSYAQERLWFLDVLEGPSPIYNIPAAIVLDGPLDVDALADALGSVVDRHEVLRTCFHELDGRPVLRVLPSTAVRPEVEVVEDLRLEDDALGERIAEEAFRPFDLAHGPLWRVRVWRLGAERHVLLLALHHVVADGWSMGVLMEELAMAYEAARAGTAPALPPLHVQYADFATWQRDRTQSEIHATQLDYWRSQLEGAPPLLALPTDRPRRSRQTFAGGSVEFSVGAELTRDLRDISRRSGTTLFMTLLAGYAVYLSRVCRQRDIVVGTPIANRNRVELEPLIGFFVNVLAIRMTLEDDLPFSEILEVARRVSLDAYANQDVPFERVVEALRPDRAAGHSPVFQTMLVLQNAPARPSVFSDLEVRPLAIPSRYAKFDLTLSFEERGESLHGTFEYNTDLFDAQSIARMARHLERLFTALVSRPDRKVSQLSFLDEDEQAQLLDAWATSTTTSDPQPLAHRRFEAWAERRADAVALRRGEGVLRYGELDARASRLARHLRAQGVAADSIVGVSLDRGFDLVVALLAIWKAGGAYLPLDPGLPRERIDFMLRDCGAELVIGAPDGAPLGGLPFVDVEAVSHSGAGTPGDGEDRGRGDEPSPDDLAYVIYTSGSTGRPKGVLIEHRGLANLAHAQRSFEIRPSSRVLQFASIGFDASIFEIVMALAGGAQLCLPPAGAVMAGAELGEVLSAYGVTCVTLTPSALRSLPEGDHPSLDTVILAGEACDPDVVGRWAKGRRLFNAYGPTETSVWATVARCRGDDRVPPIGRPIDNVGVYVLDEHRQPVPVGVVGELFISGLALARGYASREELDRERFVSHQVGSTPNLRMYRTGDLVRYRADGQLEFVGREDRQVKLRGFRIELDEIESVLHDIEEIHEAAVVVHELHSGGEGLVAYVVASSPKAPSGRALRQRLREHLPPYMVPSYIVVLDALPQTRHGKTDYAALAERPLATERSATGSAAATPIEATIAAIFSEVLGVDSVTPEDDFFELGGHSLLATRALSRIGAAVGAQLPVRVLFERSTVRALAAYVEAERATGRTTDEADALRPVPRDGDLPLSFSQERLWFLDQLGETRSSYNVPIALVLRGPVDTEALRRSIELIVERHEILRTRFVDSNGHPLQRIEPHGPPTSDVEELGFDDEDPAERWRRARALVQQEAETPFDLEVGPPFRTRLLRFDPRTHILMVSSHHIVSDAWSQGVLLAELESAYGAVRDGREPELPVLDIQYADFAVWQRRRFTDAALDEQREFWRAELLGAPQVLELPLDRPRPSTPSSRGGCERFRLGASVRDAVRALCRRHQLTPFMALMGAFAAYLARISGQRDIVIGTPVANRALLPTEPLIGFFINTIVMRFRLDEDPDLPTLFAHARRTSLDALAHQDLPFEKLVEGLNPRRDRTVSPLFQVMFAQQDAPLMPQGMAGLQVEVLEPEVRTAKFDLTLFVDPSSDDWEAALEYDAALFDAERVRRMGEHLRTMLTRWVGDPDMRLSEVPILGESEQSRLFELGRGPARPEPDRALSRRVEEIALERPDATAVVFGSTQYDYASLNGHANRLAHELVRRGAGPGALVAVRLERSFEVMAAILAIWKTRAAVVPIDPRYPKPRQAFMIEDSGARLVITHQVDEMPLADGVSVLAPSGGSDLLADRPEEDLEDAPRPEDTAYIIYTSGSTGRPKGVALPHRALSNLVQWQLARPTFAPGRCVAQFAPLSFDVAFQEIFSTWCSGGTLILVDEDIRRDPEALLRFVRAQGIERLFLPAVALQQLAEAATSPGGEPTRLREIITAGEQLRITPEVRAWFRSLPSAVLDNQYGPSETHVVTAHSMSGSPEAWPALPPIGRPIDNTEVELLDAAGQRVPVGVPGELWIRGAGLAHGYHRRPVLTAERFVVDEDRSAGRARRYRTGDLARVLPSGALEFLGRCDAQVKVRGHRVEPGEIEVALTEHPSVREAVVTAVTGADAVVRLLAYVVGEDVSLESLRADLATRLPDYLVPSRFVLLEALPLTPSGKVDRAALPTPTDGPEPARGRELGTLTEQLLANVFSDVLGGIEVGAQDDFFRLGGHSLLATRVISRVRTVFAVDLPLSAIFEHPTPASLAIVVEDRSDEASARPKLGARSRTERAGPIALSFSQERLWFLEQLRPGQSAYHLPLALGLRGELDLDALERALDEIVQRHEVLRTCFEADAGVPRQIVTDAAPVRPRIISIDGGTADLATHIREEVARPFDLAAGPLVRVLLLRLGPTDHVLVMTLHHIVADGWSLGILASELSQLYCAFVEGRDLALPELPLQYADFATWQREHLDGGHLDEGLAYWREALRDAPSVLALPTDRPRTNDTTTPGAFWRFELGSELTAAIDGLCRRDGATTYMVLLAAFAVLLSRLTGQDDIVVGTPIANRTHHETEGLIGFFVNTLAMRIDVADDPAFGALVERVRRLALDAYAHQEVPFERVVAAVGPTRSEASAPLVQAMLVVQNTPAADLALPRVHVTSLDVEPEHAKADLSWVVNRGPNGLGGALEYRTDLFDEARIEAIAAQLVHLLEGALADDEVPLSALPLLSDAEQATLLAPRARAVVSASTQSVLQMFESRAREAPGVEAVVDGARRLTYEALDATANRWARGLRATGIGREDIVALALEPSAELIIGLLAVLKAGAAYLPLDVQLPMPRLGVILEDARPRLLLTSAELADRLPRTDGDRLVLEAARAELEAELSHDLDLEVRADDLAYIIYTSGTTGTPKGVLLEHGGLANLAVALQQRLGVGPGHRLLQTVSFGFDVATADWALALCHGATLCLASREARLGGLPLVQALRDGRISHVQLPAAMLRVLPAAELPDLEVIVSGGEVCDPRTVRRLSEGRRFYNAYGPTEATVCTTIEACVPSWRVPPIGEALAGTFVEVLDERLRPVPLGVVGELCIGGCGLARGYLRQPHATQSSFVPDPHDERPGARLHRTGDLVRRRSDGSIEFVGRRDRQVKIRGIRVALAEIEAVLRSHPQVEDTVVVTHEGPGGTQLLAYVVSSDGVAPEHLGAHLHERLPAYMVPSSFESLPAIPLTANGKVDRRRLPKPQRVFAEDREVIAPRTSLERRLADVWRELLKIDRVGVDEDFFGLGGHSLMATQVASRLADQSGVEVPIRLVFEHPTIERLAAALEGKLAAAPCPVLLTRSEHALQDHVLSYSQERLWFLAQWNEQSAVYNIPTFLRLDGDLDVAALARSLDVITQRHEILRTTFPCVDGRPVQRVSRDGPVLEVESVPPETLRERLDEEAGQPFDLARGPLLRARLFVLEPRVHVLTLVMHHIISDGWSMGVLAGELASTYRAAAVGDVAELPELPIQFADYARWQRERLQGDVLAEALAYWRGALEGVPHLLELPSDRPRPGLASDRGGSVALRLGASMVEQLRSIAANARASLYMVLLAGFGAYLARISGQRDLLVGAPIANRTRTELEPLIGFFVNTLPLRVDARDEPSFECLVSRVQRMALGAYAHQDLPFEKIVEAVHPARDPSHNPLVQVMFSMQNTPKEQLRLPGLEVEPLGLDTETVKFDLSLSLSEEGAEVVGALAYRSDLFDDDRARGMVDELITLLGAAAAEPGRSIAELPLLSDSARRTMLDDWNRTETTFDRPMLLHALVSAQVQRAPDAIALQWRGGAMSYGELDARANQLAHHLRDQGVGPEEIVAICLERCPRMIVAVLGALKAGGAYMPLDPSLPQQRLEEVLAEARPKATVASPSLAARFTGASSSVIALGEDWDPISHRPTSEPDCGVSPEHPAYVMYTSGSTGRPKGVVVEHRAIGNTLAWIHANFALDASDAILQRAAYTFDASVRGIFDALQSGARLVLPDPDEGMDGFVDSLVEFRITVLRSVPSVLRMLAEQGELERLEHVRWVFSGAESLSPSLSTQLRAELGDVHNVYGPTEASVIALHHRTVAEIGDLASEPIGRPIANMRAYVVDSNLRPVPVGVPGELCLAGRGLARGYLGRDDLTTERFVACPFVQGERMYRTGDRVRYRTDGVIEYLGRLDRQVKLRGVRIELEEIERVLGEHPSVREVAVVVRGSSEGTLLAAYVWDGASVVPADHGAEELATYLKTRLPQYMVPQHFRALEQLPRTPSDKTDYRVLQELPIGATTATEFVAPRDATELMLQRFFEDALRRGPIGVNDSFFELGGHSLLVIGLKSAIERWSGRTLPLSQIFQNPSIAELARLVRDGAPPVASTLVPLGGAPGVPTAFLVSGGGGTALSMQHLARHLMPRLGCCGFDPKGMDGEEPPHDTIEAMAQEYVAAVLLAQSEGPFWLGGHSTGGHVAFEMARQLAANGHEVGAVFMLDAVAPVAGRTERPTAWDDARWVLEVARVLMGSFGCSLDLDLDTLRGMSSDDRRVALMRELVGRGIFPSSVTRSNVDGIVNVVRSQMQMHYAIHEPLPVPIVVFRAEQRIADSKVEDEAIAALLGDAKLGWQAYCQVPVTVHEVPGNHLSMLREPSVAVLADLMRRHLEEARYTQ